MRDVVNQILQSLKLSPDINSVTVKNWAASLLVTKISEILDKLEITKADVNHTHASSVPVGAIFAFPDNMEVHGYLKCDGTLYPKENYPELAKCLSNFTYTTTSETHFNVPDFRGHYLRGADDSNSSNIDMHGLVDITTNQVTNNARRTGIKLLDLNKSHTHNVSDLGHNHGAGQEPHSHGYGDSFDYNSGVSVLGVIPGLGPVVDGVGDSGFSWNGTTVSQPSVYISSNTSNISVQNSGQLETRPKSVLINYYIKHD